MDRQFATRSSRRQITRICVFCGARSGDNPEFAGVAAELGRAAARAKLHIVYGGGGAGLMGIVARAALRAGGTVTGVIPYFLLDREAALLESHELVVVNDMAARKREMAARADAFVVLPGGLGTLEELAEQICWAKLGRHDKPVVLVDVANYWRPLVALFEHMAERGFSTPRELQAIVVTRDIAETIAELTNSSALLANRAAEQRNAPRALLNETSLESWRHEDYFCPLRNLPNPTSREADNG